MQEMQVFIIAKSLSTCFGCLSTPSSGVHQTVTTASGTGHSIRATTFCQRGLRPRWQKVFALIIWPVPEAVVTVWCTPDDGVDRHPKHVESDFAIINTCICCILLDLINTEWRCTEQWIQNIPIYTECCVLPLNFAVLVILIGASVRCVGSGTAVIRRVAGWISDGVFGTSLWRNPSVRTMDMGSNRTLTEMRTWVIFREGVKAAGA